MLCKNHFFVFVVGLFVAGIFVLFLPQNASAGLAPGCCITNGDQCSPSCGPIGTSCQNDGTNFGQCNGLLNPPTCGGPKSDPATVTDCYIEGDFCFQIANNAGQCIPALPPSEPGCCEIATQNCADTTLENCTGTFFPGGTCPGGVVCEPGPPPPPPSIPTLNQWGMIIMAGFLGLIGIFFITRKFALKRSS